MTRTVDELRGFPFVVQMDDGWEQIVGDWVENEGFPSGLHAFARTIRGAGFTPGLWLAPLICLPGSTLVRDHPDWLVRGTGSSPLIAGYNWDSHYYVLDTTQHGVREHLRGVFTNVVSDGFRYLKLDFMYAGALPGMRSTATPRERVYREAIEFIREVIGPEVYLLGCGVPMVPSVGIFGVRVGPDTASILVRDGSIAYPSCAGAAKHPTNTDHLNNGHYQYQAPNPVEVAARAHVFERHGRELPPQPVGWVPAGATSKCATTVRRDCPPSS